jgi:hypothetical protein
MHTPEHAAPTGAGRPPSGPRPGHASPTPRTRPTAPLRDADITGIAGADEERVALARSTHGTVPAAPLHPAPVRARNRPRRALPAEAYGPLLPHLEPGDVTAGRTLPVVLRTARVAAAGGALPTRGAARRPSSSVAASCRAVA